MSYEHDELAMRVFDNKPCSLESDSGHLVAPFVMQEYGKRIVACWNACAGIPTDQLERVAREKWTYQPPVTDKSIATAIGLIKGATADLKESNDKAELAEIDRRDRMALKHPQEHHEPRYAQAERDYG